MKPRLILLTALLLISTFTFSQQRKLLGRVVAKENQKPIKNASIIMLGNTVTSTNHLGYFEVTVDTAKHRDIFVSHIGFKTIGLKLPKEDRFLLTLEKEYISLEQLNLIRFPKALQDSTSFNPSAALDHGNTAESSAFFPGGFQQFYTMVGNEVVRTVPANQTPFNITFTINENGEPVDLVLSDSSASLKMMVTNIFQSLPKWTPAQQLQKPVRQHFILPVTKRSAPDLNTLQLSGFYKFIQENIKYPASCRRLGIDGPVYVGFNLDDDGNASSVLIQRGIHAEADREVRRVIVSISPSLMKSLAEQTGLRKFILPVMFSPTPKPKNIYAPFKPLTDGLILKEVFVYAGALIVQKRQIQ